MSKIKTIFRYILSIILALSIILFIAVNIAKTTILDKNFVLNKLDETYYYTKICGYVKENFENYIHQSGLDESVLENIITEEQVKEDTQKIITNLYNNVTEEVSTSNLEEKLNANIKEATKEMNLTEKQKQAIKSFVDEICKEYKISISHFEHEKTLYNVYAKVVKLTELANKVSITAIGISIVVLFLLSLKRIYKAFVCIGISLLSSGLFFIIANVYINSKVKIQTITILNDAISFTLRDILETIMSCIVNNGIGLAIGGAILILISNLIHNYIKYSQN